MKYQVVVTPRARAEFYNDALWWAEHRSLDQAKRWVDGLEQALQSLGDNADRFPAAREADNFSIDLRQMNYGLAGRATHRAVFEIRDDVVIVHGIRHLSRDRLSPEDI